MFIWSENVNYFTGKMMTCDTMMWLAFNLRVKVLSFSFKPLCFVFALLEICQKNVLNVTWMNSQPKLCKSNLKTLLRFKSHTLVHQENNSIFSTHAAPNAVNLMSDRYREGIQGVWSTAIVPDTCKSLWKAQECRQNWFTKSRNNTKKSCLFCLSVTGL